MFHSQSAATHVVDDALRNADHFSSARIEAPTEVDLFHMGKEALIKPSDRQPIGAANHQSSARRPKYGTDVVILPTVALDHRKDAPATKRITIAIQIAARRTGIFKLLGATLRAKFGLASSHFGVCVHIIQERTEPSRRHFDVRIEQEQIFCVNLRQSSVVAARKSVVAVQSQDTHGGKLVAQKLQTVVRRAIVGYDYFGFSTRMRHYGGQKAAQHCSTVPIENNDGYGFTKIHKTAIKKIIAGRQTWSEKR